MITIPSGTTIIGELRSKGRIRVDGHIEGTGDIDGLLLLTRECVWRGKVTADIVIVEGTFEGDIVARRRIKLNANAFVNGNVTCPQIQIEEGAKVTGAFHMRSPDAPIGLLENKTKREAATPRANNVSPIRKAAGE